MSGDACGPGGAAFVVLAGGSGSRVGSARNKVYLPLAGRPVLSWSLRWADEVAQVGPVVLVTRAQDDADARAAVRAAGLSKQVEVVPGGATRHGSEQAALDHLAERIGGGEVTVVAIHDGARPLAGASLLATVIDVAARRGAAVPTVPVDGVWRRKGDLLVPPDAAHALHRVQTPQAFRAAPLLEAYAAARAAGVEGTDTAATLERFGDLTVVAVAGSDENLKVTFPADLEEAERLLLTRAQGESAPPPPARPPR